MNRNDRWAVPFSVRYRDEAFITWNRSEDELRTLLTIANSQFSQPIWNITDIGATIHFRDIIITNNNGLLQTSVYHEETFQRIMFLSSFPDILQPAIKQDTWKWLRAAILKAIRYCSDHNIYYEEKNEINWQLKQHQLPDIIFNEAYQEILEDFGASVVYPPYTRSSYEILRDHIFNYDRYRKATKTDRQRQQNNKTEIILQLPYIPNLDGTTIDKIEQQFNTNLSQHFKDHRTMQHITMTIRQNQSFFDKAIDYLVKKQPPTNYLTLPEEPKTYTKYAFKL
ncbi:unnamed protein product [Rotaria sp. Silwood1]|nr:unnamed protein product [Rotaria sp. Silwood1]